VHSDDSHYENTSKMGNGWMQSGPSPELKNISWNEKVYEWAVPTARHGWKRGSSRIQSLRLPHVSKKAVHR